jgi:capsular exopolysaccharide synthesis family protein
VAEHPAAPRKTSGTAGSSGSPASTTPGYSVNTDLHLLDRLAVLYRYRAVAAMVFILTTLAVVIQSYTAIPVYVAQGRLLIEDERTASVVPGLTADPGYYTDPEPYYQTQFKILVGRDLARRVVKKLQLGNVPEFNGTAVPTQTPLTVARQLVSRALIATRIMSPPREVEPPQLDEDRDESSFVSSFIGRVAVEPVRGSRLVDVTFRSMDPKFAQQAVNALLEEYVAQNLAVKQQATQNMLEWLGKELATQQQKVQDSERALAEYRDKQNALSLDDKQNIVTSRLNQLNDAVTKAKTVRVQREAAHGQIVGLPPGSSPESLAVITQNATVQNLRGKLGELQRQKVLLSERYGEKHPEIQKVNASLGDTQRQLTLEVQRALTTVKNDYDSAVLEEQTLARSLEAAKADAMDLNRKSINYTVMQREAQSNRQVYESLLQREKELRVSANSRANNIRIVDRAEVPKGATASRSNRTWLMAVALGLVLAIGTAFGLDYMNDTVKTPEDVTRRLKLPFLGLVPSIRGNKLLVLSSNHVPHDFGESFRALRTALMSKYSEPGAKTMVVTSAQPLEGKTTTACNIAMALAYGGSRVLLIDADMRRPGMHRALRLSNDRGLSQVLIGQARVRDVIQRTIDPNLLAITAGRIPPNPSELLASERMRTLLTNLAHGPFDWIIIDTPPVLAVTDGVVLAPHVSGVTFVVGAEMTRLRLAERALETIIQAHPRFTAVVLNKVDIARNRYYYSRYYGHQYKSYYAEASV